MSTLLLRLAGPMQSWGTQSRFEERDTDADPSKSGVLGLVGAAMGVARDDMGAIARLAGLTMAVRVDREGTVLRDYHTAGGGRWSGREYGVANAEGKLVGPVGPREQAPVAPDPVAALLERAVADRLLERRVVIHGGEPGTEVLCRARGAALEEGTKRISGVAMQAAESGREAGAVQESTSVSVCCTRRRNERARG